MKPFLAAVAVSAVMLPSLGQAQERWGSGYGQGIHEASIRNDSRAQFSVSCPEGSPTARPGFLLNLPDLRGGEAREGVRATIAVDGRDQDWRVDREVLDQNQVVFSWHAAGPQTEQQLSDLVRRLRRGNSVTVSVPGDEVEETFTLAGSNVALEACAGPY